MNTRNHNLVGNGGGPYRTFRGAVNTHSADVHNAVVNAFFHRHDTGVQTTLAADANIGDNVINVTSPTGFVNGDTVHLGTLAQTLDPFEPQIVNVAGNNLSLDYPLVNAYPAGSLVTKTIIDMASAAGTLAAPIVYRYFPTSGTVEHIKRIILSLIHASAADDSKFGSIAALTNGVVFRAFIGGKYKVYTTWHSNRDFIIDMFEVLYTDKAGAGSFGTRALGDFNEIDVAVELDADAGDYLEILIQDDITALLDFVIKAQGHEEGA